MNLDWTLLIWLLLLGTALAGVLMAWWPLRRRSRTDASFDSPTLPGSDWHEIAARYHHSRVEALRGWLGEDHELVRPPRPGHPATDRTTSAGAGPLQGERPGPVRVDILLRSLHDGRL